MSDMETWRQYAARRHGVRKPAVFSISPDQPFVDTLARGILEDTGGDPLALSALTVLLPTRRACRALREAFLRLNDGQPLLLPRLMPLSDMAEDDALFSSYIASESHADIPPPISPLRRQLMLARLIQSLPSELGEPHPERAIRLAQELAKLLDQVQTEQLSFDGLARLVPEDYATHWQKTLEFLGILTQLWPDIIAAEGALDPAEHRNRVFAAQAAAWAAGASTGPVIAAGSTGSIPATAQVLATVARMKDGCVVLPGLDTYLNEDDWAVLDETHPQFGIKQLLGVLTVGRDDVTPWPGTSVTADARARFISEALRPASTTHRWQTISALPPEAVTGITRIDCPSPREEAEAVALLMREALENPERTCALVTPDRTLAERVAMELARWQIDVDDSGGMPLAQTPVGTFLRLIADATASGFAPVPLLALCKHPLAAAGQDTARFRGATRDAERDMLRGPRPPAGLDGLASVATTSTAVWLDALKACITPFAALMSATQAPLSALLSAHMEAAEAFAATHDIAGPLRLWTGDDGEAAMAFVAELALWADTLPPISPSAYAGIFEALLEGRVVRPRYGRHPRLHILGPLEARLQRFDVLILSGLNEGTWPAAIPADPWMSRPMRKAFGLPAPERRTGQAAHDITQALAAPRVILTRSAKVEGTPTVPSRWLMRLERVLEAAGLAHAFDATAGDWLAWARELTKPTAPARNLPPAPRPPVPARPRELSVTQIETWMRDPYGIYARHILGLKALAPLDQDPGAADYGTLIHEALRAFVSKHPSGALPAGALANLLDAGRTVFSTHTARPGVMAFWWPRFERIAAWFIGVETKRRANLARAFVEIPGRMTIASAGGPFTVTARADRIDQMKDGGWAVIDYKTGTPPTESEVKAAFAPQLPLEAAILGAGGFKDIPAGTANELAFWHLHGRESGGDERHVHADAATLAAEAREGLTKLVAKFDDPATAYEARPNPEYAPKYSDYEHLARVKEWSAGSDEG